MDVKVVPLASGFQKGKARGIGVLECVTCGVSWLARYADAGGSQFVALEKAGWIAVERKKQVKVYCPYCSPATPHIQRWQDELEH